MGNSLRTYARAALRLVGLGESGGAGFAVH